METGKTKWICAQLGAREHYAVARALNRNGALQGLFTDVWVRQGNPLGLFKRSLRERYHAELADATVHSSNVSLLAFEARARVKGLTGWNRIMARNQWFQKQALQMLKTGDTSPRPSPQSGEGVNIQHSTFNSQPTIFAYSYAARDIFQWAKGHGWKTVLGQIDAGPEMGRIVRKLEEHYPEFQSRSNATPMEYWENWRDECALADRIIVNSEWSRKALAVEGISAGKIRVVPLAYDPPAEAAAFRREYPPAFSPKRLMRVLFLGQVNLAKGIGPVLEAAEMLRGEPVEFQIVGPLQVAVPEKWQRHPQIRWLGPIPRGAVAEHYRAADVFLFPTFSDGFGMTQLEAQAWHLPIVASRFCGDVVTDGVNGLQLAEVSAADIAHVLRQLLSAPGKLKAMSRASSVGTQFSLDGIANKLESVLD